jgi:hypothetical protein
MKITLKRQSSNGRVIDGSLIINGTKVCDTTENASNAIGAGTYNIAITYCKQYGRRMPMVEIEGCDLLKEDECSFCDKLEHVCHNTDLPSFCPMLKPGCGAYNRTDGSILLGEYIAPGCLKHPQKHFNSVFDRMRKVMGRGNECKLTVEDM